MVSNHKRKEASEREREAAKEEEEEVVAAAATNCNNRNHSRIFIHLLCASASASACACLASLKCCLSPSTLNLFRLTSFKPPRDPSSTSLAREIKCLLACLAGWLLGSLASELTCSLASSILHFSSFKPKPVRRPQSGHALGGTRCCLESGNAFARQARDEPAYKGHVRQLFAANFGQGKRFLRKPESKVPK